MLEPRVHEHGVATPEMGADRQHASTGYRSFQTARSSGVSFVNSVRANKNSAIIVDTHTRRRGEKSARNDTESHSRARATLIPESCVSSCYLPFLGPFFLLFTFGDTKKIACITSGRVMQEMPQVLRLFWFISGGHEGCRHFEPCRITHSHHSHTVKV